ncbi:MAG: hypothetical protein K6T83_03200 [Alicyclobacillus sp.]|nr:hypothetical protein [Alicyclobacillus sp.]
MDKPMQKTITAGGVTYTFRFPSQEDWIQIDLDALRHREGLTEGVPLAVIYTQNIAMMTRLCISPEDVDFGALPSYVGDKIGRELTQWVNSFSEPMEEKQNSMGKGSSK